MEKLSLTATSPFSLGSVIGSHGWARLAPFRADEDRHWLEYVIRLASGRAVAIKIEQATDGVTVEANAALTRAERADLRAKVDWMLGLQQDFSGFYARALEEPSLAHVIPHARGRILRSGTLFEDVVKTILTTNTSWAGTIRMVDALVSRYGQATSDDPSRRAFPTPERLAQLDEGTLRSEAKLGYRAPYVCELSRAVSVGELDLASLANSELSTPDLRQALLDIKGVGGYAAANLLMLLGRHDYIPIDSWALRLVSNEWYEGQPVGHKDVVSVFEDWGRWKGLAFWFWDWSKLG